MMQPAFVPCGRDRRHGGGYPAGLSVNRDVEFWPGGSLTKLTLRSRSRSLAECALRPGLYGMARMLMVSSGKAVAPEKRGDGLSAAEDGRPSSLRGQRLGKAR